MTSPPGADLPSLRDYEVTGVLGEGYNGDVFAGRHRLTGHPVALHRISAELADAPGFVERLGNSARKVAALRSPHIVGVYDLVVEDAVYLVLELVTGRSLRELAPAGQALPPATALAAVDDVLNALETAHAEGVVHGDIRAEHVLVTTQGSAKLGGFAVSQAQLLLPDHPGAKRPGYSSPERLAGLPPDARSDLYAVAALASELMTGVVPSPGRIGPAALPTVSELLQRGLSADAARRFGSATEMRTALVGAVAGTLGPSWRLASDLGPRVASAVAEGGGAASLPPAAGTGAGAGAAGAAGSTWASASAEAAAATAVPGFGAPPPPGASVMRGAAPPPPLARPPSSPPPSYLPPPEPRARAAITEIDSEERGRPPWLMPVLGIVGVLAAAGVAVGVLFGTGVLGGSGANNGALEVGNDVKLAVSPQSSGCTSNLQTDFAFVATGSVTGTGTLTYRWERSDGKQSDPIPVDITPREGSFSFTITWRVIGHQTVNGTMTFRILSPTSRVVNQAISYNCP